MQWTEADLNEHVDRGATMDYFRTGVYMPGYPVCRKLSRYAADLAATLAKTKSAKFDAFGSCGNFDKAGHLRMLMLIICAGCQNVLGWANLDQCESAKVLFEFFYTRFATRCNLRQRLQFVSTLCPSRGTSLPQN